MCFLPIYHWITKYDAEIALSLPFIFFLKFLKPFISAEIWKQPGHGGGPTQKSCGRTPSIAYSSGTQATALTTLPGDREESWGPCSQFWMGVRMWAGRSWDRETPKTASRRRETQQSPSQGSARKLSVHNKSVFQG